MNNNGKAAEKGFEEYWTRRGHLQRLRDRNDLVGLNRGAKIADFAKPADYLVSSATDPLHYAEVKSTTNPRIFSFNKIRPAQSAAALMEARRGSKNYYFYIFSYGLGKWFVMSCVAYRLLVDAGRKSVAFEELDEWNK